MRAKAKAWWTKAATESRWKDNFPFSGSEFKSLYRPFEGKIYLPRFCVKKGKDYEGLDYFRHLISQVDVEKFNYGELKWDLGDEMADKAKDFKYRATLGQNLKRVGQKDAPDFFEADEMALSVAGGEPALRAISASNNCGRWWKKSRSGFARTIRAQRDIWDW